MSTASIQPYPVRDATALRRAGTEPMGTKRKFWCRDTDGRRYLFKYSRERTGEDWSEKVAAEVADALGIPHAEVELAVYDGHPGTLTLDFTDSSLALVHGNELLLERLPSYPVEVRYGASQHTVAAVLDVLSQGFVHAPTEKEPALSAAVDWFVGYLMLDALIGNTDRHHENWGVLDYGGLAERYVALAPSYDHASSLGRELMDQDRAARLKGRDKRRTVEAYARKARSGLYRHFNDKEPVSPVDALSMAMERAQDAGRLWLSRLEGLSDGTLSLIVARVPSQRVSEPARQFAELLMVENRRALLRLLESSP